jgi:hypothetical protein
MYTVVKRTMADYPNDIRLVIRYAAFHKGSDEVERILEMARKQNKFVPVLEAVLVAQPEWADPTSRKSRRLGQQRLPPGFMRPPNARA